MAHSYRDSRHPDRLTRRETDLDYRDFLDREDLEATTGECNPPMDVLETAEAIEVVLDLPGIPASGIRILFSQGTLVVAGRKIAAACTHREAAFHLAERSFGRFARAVRLTGAFDAGRASATFSSGELRVVLPRIEERRGRDIRIEITQS